MSDVTGKEDDVSYSFSSAGKGSDELKSTKSIIFKDERSAGDLVINTASLVVPTEAASNGWVQPTVEELDSLNLIVNKKNLRVHSSRGAWLQWKEDFIITSARTIQLIGAIAELGGALEGEVFTVYAVNVQTNALLTTDVKKQYEEYVLPEGQSVLNLGREYEVGRNPLRQLGAIRVYRNGAGPLLRNVGNVTADPSAEGNYQEIDGINGVGTQIEFNDPATGADDVVVVEFGLEYAGDLSIVGDIESVYGGLLAMANQVGPELGLDPANWLTANPSQVERRAFGDSVLDLLRRYNNQANVIPGNETVFFRGTSGSVGGDFAVPNSSNTLITFASIADPQGILGGATGNTITFPYDGLYYIRYASTWSNTMTGASQIDIFSQGTLGWVQREGQADEPTLNAPVKWAAVVDAQAGQTFQLLAFQNTGAPRQLGSVDDDRDTLLIRRIG